MFCIWGFFAAHIAVQSDQTMDPLDSGFAFEEPKSKILTWCEGIPQPILQGNSVRSSGCLHFMKTLCITRHCRKALQCELSNTGNSVEGHTSSSPLQSSFSLSLQLFNSILLLDQKSLTSLPFQAACTCRHRCSYQATASLSSPHISLGCKDGGAHTQQLLALHFFQFHCAMPEYSNNKGLFIFIFKRD